MKSLIIGSNSFLGYYLMNYIKNIKKEEVYGVSFSNFSNSFENYEFEFLDINNRNSIKKRLMEISPDKIYCLDIIDSVSYVWDHPKE